MLTTIFRDACIPEHNPFQPSSKKKLLLTINDILVWDGNRSLIFNVVVLIYEYQFLD